MITAKEAREILGISKKVYLEFIEGKIREEAKQGYEYVIIRDKPYCDWIKDKFTDELANEVLQELKANGFGVELHYEEGQLVDYGLKITWY